MWRRGTRDSHPRLSGHRLVGLGAPRFRFPIVHRSASILLIHSFLAALLLPSVNCSPEMSKVILVSLNNEEISCTPRIRCMRVCYLINSMCCKGKINIYPVWFHPVHPCRINKLTAGPVRRVLSHLPIEPSISTLGIALYEEACLGSACTPKGSGICQGHRWRTCWQVAINFT